VHAVDLQQHCLPFAVSTGGDGSHSLTSSRESLVQIDSSDADAEMARLQVELRSTADVSPFGQIEDDQVSDRASPQVDELIHVTVDTHDSTHDIHVDSPIESDDGRAAVVDVTVSNLSIGELLSDDARAIDYVCRLVCTRFLLTGVRNQLLDDVRARVSHKSLAMGVLGAAVNTFDDASHRSVLQLYLCTGKLHSARVKHAMVGSRRG
jgi:hypothetical protein